MNTERLRSPRPFLPFRRRFHAAIRDGTKRFTLRPRHYGEQGQVIDSSVGPIRIVRQRLATPLQVGAELWREEGCRSADDFYDTFRRIYPKRSMERDMVLHEFELVRSGDPACPDCWGEGCSKCIPG